MDKREFRKAENFQDLRLDPERRLCPQFDSTTIKLFPMARPGEMGFRVVDNFAEEHIM